MRDRTANESPRKDYKLIRNCGWIDRQHGELFEACAMNIWWHSLAGCVVSLLSHSDAQVQPWNRLWVGASQGWGHSKAKMLPDENEGGARQGSRESSMPEPPASTLQMSELLTCKLPLVLYSSTKSYFLTTNVWCISRNSMWQIIWNNTGPTIIFAFFCFCFKYLPHYVAQNNRELKIPLPLPLEY